MSAVSATAPASPATDGELTADQVTYAVLVPRPRVRLLAEHLDLVRKNNITAGIHITVVYPEAARRKVNEITEGMSRVRLVEVPDITLQAFSRALAEEVRHLYTPYLVAHLLGTPVTPEELLTSAAEVARQWAGQGWGAHAAAATLTDPNTDLALPLLLPIATTPAQVSAHYVEVARRLPGAAERPWQDYLGHLSLLGCKPVVEGVDPAEGGVVLHLALGSRTLQTDAPPGWRYRVVLRHRDGRQTSSGPLELRERFAKVGASSWDDLVAFVPLDGLDNGTYEILLELDSDTSMARSFPLKPRLGALLSSRSLIVPVRNASSESRSLRYQVFPSSGANRSHIRVQRRTGFVARTRWTARMAFDDVRFAFRRNVPGQMRWLRILRMLTLPFFSWRTIWLIGERYDTAQDNGMHLFRHLRGPGARRGRGVYYVIDDDSPQRDVVEGLGHVIPHSSWRHRLYMLHARAVVGAYSLHYLIPRQWKGSAFAEHVAWRTDTVQVYIRHGIHMSPRAVRRGSTGYDIMLTSTPRETEALRAVSGYDEQLSETGLPRYDALQPSPPSRTILFMPTWRQYLIPKLFGKHDENQPLWEGSTYHRFMTDFLTHPRLYEMLTRHDYRLVMLPHYNMADLFAALPLAGERLRVADLDETPVQEQLINCDGFITDYSSVHFDVAYLNTPLIYARFDEEEYETLHAAPGWFDYDNEGFGPVARDLDQTLDALETMLAGGCEQPALYRDRVDAAFLHRDDSNCERVVARIEEVFAARHRPLSGVDRHFTE